MAKQRSHYVKQTTKKPYLSKRDIKTLAFILGALILTVVGYIAVRALLDDSLPVKDGKVVTSEGDWLIVNEGSSGSKKYYAYCAYDFSALDAEVENKPFTNDENLGEVYVYPADGRYSYACVYANKFTYDETAANVQSQMSALVSDGSVTPLTDIDMQGRPAKAYSYYTRQTDAEKTSYTQIFSCYIKSDREGCVVARIGWECESEAELLTEAQGYAYLKEISECLRFAAAE